MGEINPDLLTPKGIAAGAIIGIPLKAKQENQIAQAKAQAYVEGRSAEKAPQIPGFSRTSLQEKYPQHIALKEIIPTAPATARAELQQIAQSSRPETLAPRKNFSPLPQQLQIPIPPPLAIKH